MASSTSSRTRSRSRRRKTHDSPSPALRRQRRRRSTPNAVRRHSRLVGPQRAGAARHRHRREADRSRGEIEGGRHRGHDDHHERPAHVAAEVGQARCRGDGGVARTDISGRRGFALLQRKSVLDIRPRAATRRSAPPDPAIRAHAGSGIPGRQLLQERSLRRRRQPPVTDNEVTNPNFHGCIDRSA